MVAIGIDLGTTNSVVAVWKDGKAIIITNDEGHRVTPSIVAFTATSMLIGNVAKSQVKFNIQNFFLHCILCPSNQMVMNTENTVYEAKRIIGQKMSDPVLQSCIEKFPFKIVNDEGNNLMIQVMFHCESTTFRPEQISGFVLQKMKTLAESFLHEPVTDAVITIPAYFDNMQRQATFDAAQLAELNVLKIIHEPTAAALAYGLEFQPKVYGFRFLSNISKIVMVFFLNAGYQQLCGIRFGRWDV
jgi:molecular chaperone DnaK (HSP70)